MSGNSSSSGISFCGLLTIVFIVLKLTHYIDWSWLWVLSPLMIGFAFTFGVLAMMIIITVLSGAKFTIKRKEKYKL